MSPEERQLLSSLFDRVRGAVGTPRDPEAERLIADAVRSEPASPYYLAQAVIVQEKGLEAAAKRIAELEARVRDLEAGRAHDERQEEQRGGFLSSIFGSGQPPRPMERPLQQPPQQVRTTAVGPWDTAPGPAAYPQQPYPQQSQPAGPWSQQMRTPSAGSSFLTGALGTAAGVAGGMLLANSLSGVFGSHMAGLGLGSPAAEGFGNANAPVEETVINNYYGDAPEGADTAADPAPADNSGDGDVQTADFQSDDSGSWDDAGDTGGGDDSNFA